MNGHAVGGTHKAKDAEGDIARAILLHMWMGQTTVAGSRRPAHAVPAHAGYHHDYLHNVEFSQFRRREAAKALHGLGPVRGEL